VVGIDLDDPKLRDEWKRRSLPNLEFRPGLADSLPYADGAFECVTAMEVLEHVPDPDAVLGEMARVTSSWLLVSVPREPLWRALNMARGAYLRDRGNTPGHLNHWSKRSFAGLLGRYGETVELRSPFPWTMALVRVRAA
jgi:SAM-dependent methyltransferase